MRPTIALGLLVGFVFGQDVRIDLLEPVPQQTGASISFSTQNFFPEVGDLAVVLLSQTSAFRATDILEEKRLQAPPALFSGLPDGTYYARGYIEHDGLVSPHSNIVSFVVQQEVEPLPVPTLLIENTAPLIGDYLDIRFTPINHLDLLHYEIEVSDSPNFPRSSPVAIPANETAATLSVSSFSGEGFLWVRGRGVFREGVGEWSTLESIAYRRVDRNFYVLPHVARGDWETWLFLSVPNAVAGSTVNASASYLRPSALPGDPGLTVIPLSIRAGEFFILPISDEIQGAPIFFESELPLVIAAHYVDNDRGGVLQVPRFEKKRRQALTGMILGDGVTSGVVFANTENVDALVNYDVRVDSRYGQVFRGNGALLVPRYEERVYSITHFWPGDVGEGEEVQVSIIAESDGSVALLGGTFYHSEEGVFPSYFLGVEVHEGQALPLKE